MQHFFLEEKINNKFKVPSDILHQMRNVLKFNSKTKFTVINNKRFYICNLIEDMAFIQNEINSTIETEDNITIAIGALKGKKMEMVVQKLTEIGVKKIIIIQMERSIADYSKSIDNKISRWNTIMKEAAEQSKRTTIPEIFYIKKLEDIKKHKMNNNIVCYEKISGINPIRKRNDSLILIGPEGGITSKEIDKLIEYGFIIHSLTKTILRSETAAIYVASKMID